MPTSDVRAPASAQADEAAGAHLTGLGVVSALEGRLESLYGVSYGLAMPSATTALLGLGMALGIRDREFIATPLSYGGTLAAWLALGGRPRFADVDARTLTLDPESVRARLTLRTVAILAVELFGHPCDDVALRQIADDAGVPLIVDGAQSFGARRDGRAAGIRGHALVTSFTSGKVLDAGDGGAALTGDMELYARLLWHTQHPERQKLELGLDAINECAINGRMAPSVAVAALNGFDAALALVCRRQEQAARIREIVEDTGTAEVPVGPDCHPSWLRMTARWCGKPDAVLLERCLAETGTPAALCPPPVSFLPESAAARAMMRVSRDPCPVALDELARRCWIKPLTRP